MIFSIQKIPPPLSNACDFVFFFFIIAQFPEKMNTPVDFLHSLENDTNENFLLRVQEDVSTQPIEINIQSIGITQEDQFFFHTEDAELPPKNSYGSVNSKKCDGVHTEPPVITVSHCYINDNCTNILMQRMEPINKVPRTLIEKKCRARAT